MLNFNAIYLDFYFNFFAAECKQLSDQLTNIRKELNETKSQVVVAEYKRETDIQYQDRKAQEEIASLQHLVHGIYISISENSN